MKARFLILALSLFAGLHAGAQISTRPGEENRQRQAKDTSLDKKILVERQYDSLIHQSEGQIKALQYQILLMQKEVEAAKAHLKELEESQKGFKANQTLPKAELEQRISDTNKKIKALLTDIENKKAGIEWLKQKITGLEKEKQEALKKL